MLEFQIPGKNLMFQLVLDRPCRSSVVCRNLSGLTSQWDRCDVHMAVLVQGPSLPSPDPGWDSGSEGECVVRQPGSSLAWTEFYTLMVVSHSLIIYRGGQIHFTYLAKYNFFLLRVLTYKWDKQYVLLLILMLSLSNSERFSLFTCKKFRVSWWSQLQPFQSCLPLDFSPILLLLSLSYDIPLFLPLPFFFFLVTTSSSSYLWNDTNTH